MPIEKTDAIILKSFNYGDTSKIARCYTREFGKISIIGKGIRKGKMLQSGYFEPMNYLSLLFYYNPRRQLQIFSKGEFKHIWRSLQGDIKKLTYGFAVVELVDRSVTGEEPYVELFNLIVDILQTINTTSGNINLIFWYFEMQLLSLLGFRPQLTQCPGCNEELSSGYFSSGDGELLCNNCYGKRDNVPEFISEDMIVSAHSIDVLQKLKRRQIQDIMDIRIRSGDRKEIGGFLNNYLRFHVESVNELRSLKVLGKILNNGSVNVQ